MSGEKRGLIILLALMSIVVAAGVACSLFTPKEPAPEPPAFTRAAPGPTAVRGGLQPVMGLPAMEQSGLWVAPGGEVWVTGDQGVYRRDGAGWTQLSGKPAAAVLGSDGAGRVWVVFQDGAAIGCYQDRGWSVYDRQAGWEPLPEIAYLSPGPADSLLTDTQGRVWWATGLGELRRFDPKTTRWIQINAQAMGLPPANPDYQGHFITSLAQQKDGSILAGVCAGEGEAYQPVGVSRFKDNRWQLMASTTKDCVMDLASAPDGTVWAGGFDALLELCPGCSDWKRIPLPAFDRKQLVLGVDVNPQSEPWVEVTRYGGASAFGQAGRYALKDSKWAGVYGPASFENTALAFGKDAAYLEAGGVLYGIKDGGKKELAKLEPGSGEYVMRVDGSGQVWIARLWNASGGLWIYRPE